MQVTPIETVAADEALQARFLKGYKRDNILSVFTYVDRNYIDADTKKKGLVRLTFDSLDGKVDFLRRNEIKHERHTFPELRRTATGAQFIRTFRKHRIETRDIERVAEYPTNFVVYFRGVTVVRLGYVSVKRRTERALEVLHWLHRLVDAGNVDYDDHSDEPERPMLDMWDWT